MACKVAHLRFAKKLHVGAKNVAKRAI